MKRSASPLAAYSAASFLKSGTARRKMPPGASTLGNDARFLAYEEASAAAGSPNVCGWRGTASCS